MAMTYDELLNRLNHIFDTAAIQLSMVPATPEQQHSEGDFKAHQWSRMKFEITKLFGECYIEIPGDDLPAGVSARTVLLERAVREMTNKIIEYPSTPYTQSNTESLAAVLQAIKTSMEIDRMNLTGEE